MKTSLKCSCGNARFGFILGKSFVAGSLFRSDTNRGLEFIICRQLDPLILSNLQKSINNVMCPCCFRNIGIISLTDSVKTTLVLEKEEEIEPNEEIESERKD